jgi:4-hydroxy-tetrahydrodipicolinate reductase
MVTAAFSLPGKGDGLPTGGCQRVHAVRTDEMNGDAISVVIFGDGGLGRVVAGALAARGDSVRVLGRPSATRHRPEDVGPADFAVDASRGDAVLPNVAAALEAGCRSVIVATTAWEADRRTVESLLVEHGAAAVVAPNFSLGVVLFGRLVETATSLFGGLDEVDPYLVEWHRRTKADRPSGTARDLAQRILANHPRKTRLADPTSGAPPAPDELEVTAIRAGASPGMHLVGFDAPGETVELRLTARDRSAYAAGILAAADWLRRAPRSPGIHPFDPEVIDDLLQPTVLPAVPAGRAVTAVTAVAAGTAA